YNEQIVDLAFDRTSSNNQPIEQSNALPNGQSYSTWILSPKMQEIIDKFEDTILSQFPCVPCFICSKLMYPEKSLWIQRDSNFSYPLANYMTLVTNPNPPENLLPNASFFLE
ncbi:3541_t:CDS:2, partial [Cetraspora pellucida]